MINFGQIYEGWRNKLVPPTEMKALIHDVSQERLTTCSTCPFHSKFHSTPLRPDNHCTDCGCNLEAKTACLSCSCPQNKWASVMTNPEEEDQLKKDVNNG
jgi:hypothetical protein